MKHFSLILLLPLLTSCQGIANKTAEKSSFDTKNKTHMVGGKKDKHGCLTAAGYTWSNLRKECIRLFEVGIRIRPINNTETYEASGFLVFGSDSSKVELFLPSTSCSEILKKKADKYENTTHEYKLYYTDSTWNLEKHNSVIYTSQ